MIEVESPKTQSSEAIKSLLTWKKVSCDPMPADIGLDNGRLMLVLSNKKDAYYTVTARACSCPAATYHPGQPCKHQRKYFPQLKKTQEELEDLKASLPGWPGGFNGPVDLEEIKAKI